MNIIAAPPKAGFPVRYRVVAFTILLAALTYLDRVCISVLAPHIMREFSLSQIEMSYVFSAFTLSYAIFEIPTAWWADRIGSRSVVARIVAWWSTFTIASGLAFNYVSLLAIRFLFGAGEAGAWPNAARVFSRWIPASERGTVQGFFFAGALLSGSITPLLVTALLGFLSWRAVFFLCGSLGFVWAVAWYRWFRDEPADHPSVSPQEAEKIMLERKLPAAHGEQTGTWLRILRLPSLLPICLEYIANSYAFYFLITWFPTYLEKARGFSQTQLGVFAGLPLAMGVVGVLSGGWTSDRLTRRFGLRIGRCAVGFIAYLLATAAMIGGAAAEGPRTSVVLIALATCASMFTVPASWATCIDIGGRHSGVLSAAMNTSGQVGGILSPIVLAYLVDTFGDWALPLYVVAGLHLIGAFSWLLIRPDHPLETPPANL